MTGGRSGQDAAFAHQNFAETVGGRHADRGLDDLAVQEAAIAADHQGRAGLVLDHIEHRLNEIFRIVRLLEDFDLLAQAGGAGFLVGKGRGGMCHGHGQIFPQAVIQSCVVSPDLLP